MPRSNKKARSRRNSRAVPPYVRKTYMLDEATLADFSRIQASLRAATASEAMRYSIRKVAEMLEHVRRGAQITAKFPGNRRAVIMDLPVAPS